MKARLQAVGNGGDGTMSADIANVRAEIVIMESRIIKWVVGTMLTSTGLAASIAFGLAHLFNS